jgi:hypothetical protein
MHNKNMTFLSILLAKYNFYGIITRIAHDLKGNILIRWIYN